MAQLLDRADTSIEGRVDAPPASRPVVLATLSVRVDPTAERMALESALEARSELILANLMPLRPYPMTAILAPDCTTLPHEEDLDAVRATAQRAAALGIRTQLLRISTPRPTEAVLEVCCEHQAGLLVFGPDLRRTSRLLFWYVARRIRRKAPCLVWIAPDG
jgi:nucleotide-binding universal stress UspA family protein